MKNLTATDRSALIRLASSLPKGSENKRAILSGLKAAARDWDAPNFTEALALLQPHVRDMVSYLNRESRYTWKASTGGSVSAGLSYGEGASVSISTKVPQQEGGGFWTFKVAVSGERDEVVVDLTAPRWQSGGGRPARQGWGQKYSDLSHPSELFPHVPGSDRRR